MISSNLRKVILSLTAAAALVTTVADASAKNYIRHSYRGNYAYGHRYHGPGPGAAIAGAALGIIGAGIAGAAASHYYNGYPAYSYGPGYGPSYGYDYHPGYGYYGPY